MKRTFQMKVLLVPILILILSLFLYFASARSQEFITITGTITETEKIVTDQGQVYDIVDNQKGDELSLYTGKRFQVKGKVIGDGEAQQIMVFQFSIVKKPVPKESEKTLED